MPKYSLLVLSLLVLLCGCPEDPSQTDPVETPPKDNPTIQDAGTSHNAVIDSGSSPAPNPPASDAGAETDPTDAGVIPSMNDAGTSITTTPDSGQPHTASDAGQPSTPLLQGDAGLLDIPSLSIDGGVFTPEAFLYIRNISLPENENGFVEVMINSDVAMGGLQFMLTGIEPVAGSTAGGLVEATNGFTGTLTAAGQFLAFTMTSDTLPPHNGPLVEIPMSAITSTEICITDIVISDALGDAQLLSYSECKSAP